MSDIPKEKQTAFERWEMNSFGDERPSALAEKAAQQTALSMQQLAEVALMKESAKKEGFAAGYNDGMTTGLHAASARVTEQSQALINLAESFSQSVKEIDKIAAQSVLDLAMDIAKAMVKVEIKAQPELLSVLISKSLHSLPFTQNISITVHPNDAEMVKTALKRQISENDWAVIEDDTLQIGGCKIDSDKNHIDLSNERRWELIAEYIGASSRSF